MNARNNTGSTDLIGHGATRTRFEHSLGVMHVATLLFINSAASFA